ncbi:MAG: DUF4397 domain-containing protein [Ardenticatenaceae bacterium]|nr:DUF4397 domain-containing protein [Ardenticatenaceae bacterium]
MHGVTQKKLILLLPLALALSATLWLTGQLRSQTVAAQTATNDARLYVAHLAPFAMDPGTSVTVTLNNTAVLTNFEYGDSTGYLDVVSGTYDVEIFAGSSGTAAITGTVDLMAGEDYTAIAIGDGANQSLALLPLGDDNSAPPAGQAKIRLGHLAPFTNTLAGTTADVRLQDDTILLDDVQFGTVDVGYTVVVTAGLVDVKITSPDGTVTLIDPRPFMAKDGDVISAFAVGDGTNQDLGVFAITNGSEGVFLPLETESRLYVAHLAPFAMDPGTGVTVTLDSNPVLTNFEYGDSTGYLSLDPMTYTVEIFPGGSGSAAISGTVGLMAGQDYTAIAIGDGANQSLGLVPLIDDNTPPPAGQAKIRLGHLAPFASALVSTTADVRLQDGTVLLDDVVFGVVDTAYMVVVPAGVVDVKITTPDGSTTLIDPAPFMANDGDIISAFATGDGTNQPLGVFAIINGQEGFFLTLMTEISYLPVAAKN